MKPAPIPADEPTRQRALEDLALIDSPDEPAFDDLAHLAAIICGTPIALISLVDGNRQWFKSRVGLAASETPRDISFCGHAIVEDRLFEVPDAAADPRFANNPLVVGEPRVRFYAAVPLAPDGRHNVGTLCVIDHVPRRLTNEQREALSALGRQAVRLMDMRNASRREVGLRRDLFAQSDLSRSMIEHAGEAIISADLTGVIRSFNPAAERLLGYTAADLVNRATPEIFHDPAEVAQRAAELSAQCGEAVTGFQTFVHPLRQQDAHAAEWTYVRKDGTRIPILLTVSILKDDGGQPVGYLGMARDLTDRHRQAEQERTVACIMDIIRTSQADFIAGTPPAVLFERLINQTLEFTASEYGFIGEVLHDERGHPYLKTHALTNIAWNEETQALYEANRVSGFTFRNLHTLFGAAMTSGEPVIANDPSTDPRRGGLPKGHPEMRCFLGIPLAYGSEMVGLLGLANRPDGYDPELINSMAPLTSSCGSLIKALRLEAERAAANRTVAEQEHRLRLILETAADCFIEVDPDGRIAEWNRHAEVDLRVSRENAIGRAVDEIVQLHDAGGKSTGLRAFAPAAGGHPERSREVTVMRAGGTTFPADLVVWPVPTAAGVGHCAFLRDIGERRQLEEQQRLRFQSETLLKEVHHRVKNNMQVISSLLSIQSAKLEGEQQRGVFLECRERIRAMSLIHDRLYSTGTYEQIDFAEYLREMLALIVSSNRPDGTEVAVTLEAVPLKMSVDRAVPLSLIASELVLNSLKHGFRGRSHGTLVVRLERRGDDCLLFVGDDGPGIGRGVTNRGGVGMQLVETLTRQIRGRHEVRPDPPGAGVMIHWREP
jgi:PAS domain S-box-containing protein